MDLLDEMEKRVVVADGAMGTQLFAAGVAREACLEELCVSRPELVSAIHTAYLDAGARIIRTNSFGANAARLGERGLEGRVAEFNWCAAQIAREAVKGRGALVAGSVGPLARASVDPIGSRRIFESQMGALLDGGAQCIVLETFHSLAELHIAVEVKHSLHHCPVICCLAREDAAALADAWAQLRDAGADVVGVNCTAQPRTMPALFESAADPGPHAAFPNAGLDHALAPAEFAEIGRALADRGVRLLGGCCGTTPTHIAAIAQASSDERGMK
jgi:homocysteine S-methyltransferase